MKNRFEKIDENWIYNHDKRIYIAKKRLSLINPRVANAIYKSHLELNTGSYGTLDFSSISNVRTLLHYLAPCHINTFVRLPTFYEYSDLLDWAEFNDNALYKDLKNKHAYEITTLDGNPNEYALVECSDDFTSYSCLDITPKYIGKTERIWTIREVNEINRHTKKINYHIPKQYLQTTS